MFFLKDNGIKKTLHVMTGYSLVLYSSLIYRLCGLKNGGASGPFPSCMIMMITLKQVVMSAEGINVP